jgi:hypothetical protein
MFTKINNNRKQHIISQKIINRLVLKNEKKKLFDNYNKIMKSKSSNDISKESILHKKNIDLSIKFSSYSKNNNANQSKNSFANSLVINNELTNDYINVYKNKNSQSSSTINQKHNIPRIILYNNNINIDFTKDRKNEKSKTLKLFFNKNNNNQNNQVINKIKLIKSSSLDRCIPVKQNMKEINNNNLKNKLNNNELIIPFIKNVKYKNIKYKINSNNYRAKSDGKYFNVPNKKIKNNINIIP